MVVFSAVGWGVLSNKHFVLSKSLLDFLTFSLGAYDFLGKGTMLLDDMISVLDLFCIVNSRISSSF